MKLKNVQEDESDGHQLSEHTVELRAGEFYEREWEALADFETVAALIETLEGSAEVEFQGPPGEWSKLKGVRLYAGKLTKNIKKVAVRIKAITASTVRVTVAFLRKEAWDGLKRASCKACKVLVRFAINALLVSIGVPTLSIDVPLSEHFDIAGITKHLGAIVHSAGAQLLPEGLADFFAGLGPKFWLALQGVLGVVDVFTDHVDRGLEAACRVIGCCAEKKA